MRTIVVLVAMAILILGVSLPLHAEGLVFGVKGGVNMAKLTGDVGSVDWRTAFTGGAFLSWPIGEIFVLQPEAIFTMKGAKEQVTFEDTPVDLTVKLTYFEIPILARVNIPTSGTVDPYVFAGPAFGFKVSAKGQAEAGGFTAEEDIEGIASTDVGIVAGAGLEFRLTSIRLLIEGRYEAGLMNVNDSELAGDAKNAALSFMAGLGFPF
jgi:hypothetical protein